MKFQGGLSDDSERIREGFAEDLRIGGDWNEDSRMILIRLEQDWRMIIRCSLDFPF